MFFASPSFAAEKCLDLSGVYRFESAETNCRRKVDGEELAAPKRQDISQRTLLPFISQTDGDESIRSESQIEIAQHGCSKFNFRYVGGFDNSESSPTVHTVDTTSKEFKFISFKKGELSYSITEPFFHLAPHVGIPVSYLVHFSWSLYKNKDGRLVIKTKSWERGTAFIIIPAINESSELVCIFEPIRKSY